MRLCRDKLEIKSAESYLFCWWLEHSIVLGLGLLSSETESEYFAVSVFSTASASRVKAV